MDASGVHRSKPHPHREPGRRRVYRRARRSIGELIRPKPEAPPELVEGNLVVQVVVLDLPISVLEKRGLDLRSRLAKKGRSGVSEAPGDLGDVGPAIDRPPR